MALTELEKARQAYLLVLCRRKGVGREIAREYLEEKVIKIYRATEVWEITNHLDLEGRAQFEKILQEGP